jgi:hypothetical protein
MNDRNHSNNRETIMQQTTRRVLHIEHLQAKVASGPGELSAKSRGFLSKLEAERHAVIELGIRRLSAQWKRMSKRLEDLRQGGHDCPSEEKKISRILLAIQDECATLSAKTNGDLL